VKKEKIRETQLWECAWDGLQGIGEMKLFSYKNLLFLTLLNNWAHKTGKVAVCFNTGECFNQDFFTSKVKPLKTDIREIIFQPTGEVMRFGDYKAGIFIWSNDNKPYLKLFPGLTLANQCSNAAEALSLKDGMPCFAQTFCHEYQRLGERIVPVEFNYRKVT
jgi:hypothetical protein